MRIFLTFPLIFIGLAACYSQKNTRIREGVITVQNLSYKNPGPRINISPLERVPEDVYPGLETNDLLFYGPYCLEFVPKTTRIEWTNVHDGSSKDTIRRDTLYWLIDNKLARCFQFRGPSDTAGIIERYKLKDKPVGVAARGTIVSGNPEYTNVSRVELPDTIIAGRMYRRLQQHAEQRKTGNVVLFKYYFDPSTEGLPDFYSNQNAEVNGEERGFLKLLEAEAYAKNDFSRPIFRSMVLFNVVEKPLDQKWRNLFNAWIERVVKE